MNLKSVILVSFIGVALAACNKHAGDVDEPIPTATITITNPTDGAVYKNGDSIRIQGLAIASANMHGYEVSIKNAADTSVVYFSQHIHDHNDTLQINQAWQDTLTTATKLQVQVLVVLDHDGHTASKTASATTSPN